MKAPGMSVALRGNSLAHARRLLGFLGRSRQRLSPLLILTHDFPDPGALTLQSRIRADPVTTLPARAFEPPPGAGLLGAIIHF
jgi:hypothetical protein